MPFLAPLLPALLAGGVTAGASALGSKLFGGNKASPIASFQPSGINAGGLTSSFSGPNMNVTASPERLGLVGQLASVFPEQANFLAGQRAQVEPGFGELTRTRLAQIEDARRGAVGNLRENLQRRRVLGSSFGQDALTRAEAEFAGLREKTSAESFLQSLEMTNQLAGQEFAARRGEFQTFLDELNLEADVATKLTAKATETLGANARIQAQLDAQAAAGAGKFFGQAFEPVSKAVANLKFPAFA